MTNRTLNLDSALYQYLLDVSLRETPLLKRLREETAQLVNAQWQIAPEQGQFMALLVQLSGSRLIVEVGTFTGYSALCMAQAMPEEGRLICCDIPGEYNATAERLLRDDKGEIVGLTATIEQFPGQQSALGVQTLVAFIKDGTKPADKVLLLTPVAITKDNLNIVLDAGWISKKELCQGVKAGTVAVCK